MKYSGENQGELNRQSAGLPLWMKVVAWFLPIIVFIVGLYSTVVAIGVSKAEMYIRMGMVEKNNAAQDAYLERVSESIRITTENANKLANRLDSAEKFGTENRERIRSLETTHNK
jgi:hypothetical protein